MPANHIKQIALTCLTSTLLTIPATAFANPQMASKWKGHIQLPGQKLNVFITLKQENNKWSGSIDIPAQRAKGLALIDFKIEGNQASFKIKGVPGEPTFNGKFQPEKGLLEGKFLQGGQTFTFSLNKPDGARAKKEQAELSKKIEEIKVFIEKERKNWKVPGVGVGIVKGDKVLLSQGFGLRNQQSKQPVTDHTLFAIGSTTKAFTSVIMGNLIDEGLIDWNSPIKTFLPEFKLKDRYATEKINTRDLLTHQSGLPRHDLMWYGSPFSRQDIFKRLKFLAPSTSFRNKFQYQNLMFMTAGYLAEKMTNQSWEELVLKRIFNPLLMNESNFSIAEMRRSPDHALPYKLHKDKIEQMPFRSIDAVGPAGSINSNVVDMLKWVKLNLNGNPAIISPGSLKEIHSPQVVMSRQSPFSEIPFMLYGMGWMIFPYQSKIMHEHGGNIDGFSAHVSMMPEENLGVVILTNQNGSALPTVLNHGIYERLANLKIVDWTARLKKGSKMQAKAQKQGESGKKGWTRTSHDLKDYAGKYSSKGYGDMIVTESFGQLTIQYNGFKVPLKHWHYDVFALNDQSNALHGLKVQFLSNIQGELSRIAATLDQAAPPVIFARQPDPRLFQLPFLRKVVGKYDLFGLEITVKLKGSKLYASIPGQPTDELVPHRDLTFRVKSQPQVKVSFILEGNRITKAQISQPNGTFDAKRK